MMTSLPFRITSGSGAFLLIALRFKSGLDKQLAIKVETDRKNKAIEVETFKKHKAEVDSLRENYKENLGRLLTESMEICIKRTGTPCTSASDIVPFLAMYAKTKAIKEKKVVGITTKEDTEDCEVLEALRGKGMDFWLDRVLRQKLPLRFFNNKPGRYDLIAFSTFHWAVYMVISKCAYKEQGNEPYTYTWMLSTKSKLTDEDKKNIEDYRNTIKNEFPRIHREVYETDPAKEP